MTDLITLTSGALTAAINPFGAELTHLRDAEGLELMTDADPAFWTGHAPILFPVIGVVNEGIRIGGTAYAMPKHGVARHSLFQVIQVAEDRATFRLTDSPETRAVYPFGFVLEIEFMLESNTLSVDARLTNPGPVPLPASFGFHPAFAWPLPYGAPRADHRILFAADEPGLLRELTGDGLVLPEGRPSPLDGRTLHLADALFEKDALIWAPVASGSVQYGAPTGSQIEVTFPDTPMLGIWTKPGAAYICIEPWHGIADPIGFVGEFADKPGVEQVAPGETRHFALHITLHH